MAPRLYRYSVTAVSEILAGLCAFLLAASVYADVPDLSWTPKPFTPVADPDARYIDYINGRDSNPGTKEQPWKHHPWDRKAQSRAAKAAGIATYYFKQGVVYYGSLVADESGNPGKPIRLTVDPDWGTGDAVLAGSQPVQGEWHICNSSENKVLPLNSRTNTWCIDTTLQQAPLGLWERAKGELTRVTLARTPNWTVSNPSDPRSEWNEVQDVLLELTLNVRSTQGFTVGDTVHSDRSRDHPGRITHIESGKLTLIVPVTGYRSYAAGKQISNDRITTSIEKSSRRRPPVHQLIDPRNLTEPMPSSYKGATLWIEPRRLPIPITTMVIGYDPGQSVITTRISLGPESGPVANSRYFLEGLPQFLDSPGEYAYKRLKKSRIRLFLRLPGDQNPNKTLIEVAANHTLLRVKNQHHIEVSGLRLRSTNQVNPRSPDALEAPLHASAVQIRGSSSHIKIHHCAFDNLPAGVIGYPADDGNRSILDHITVQDSTFNHIDGAAIALGNGQRRKKFAATSSRLIHVDILRNRFHDIGLLSLGQRGTIGVNGNAIFVHGGEIVEIAHNHIRRVGGSGINLLLGSEYSKGHIDRPFLRGLIHHNKVVDSLLTGYDFGGISVWTGGPAYVYNNISGNPVGYLHTSRRGPESDTLQRTSYGIGIYLDGAYKAYVFNNIVWGLTNDLSKPIYNAAAYNEAAGFMHMVFNNTLYKFGVGLHRGGGIQHNRNYYLSNLILDMSHKFIQHKTKAAFTEYESIAFKNNVFQGSPVSFGQLGKGIRKHTNLSLPGWKSLLAEKMALEDETGTVTASEVVVDAQQHDFRPRPGSAAIGKGSKVFAPWALSRVVGEWHFYRTRKQPAIVMGENINMNDEWVERMMFDQIPRNNLICPNTGPADFVPGLLENWIPGALDFDGQEQYCILSHESLTAGYTWQVKKYNRPQRSGKISSHVRDTVDIDDDNFIIESVLKVRTARSNTGIMNKRSGNGYELLIDDQGRPELVIDTGNKSSTRTATLSVNDGQWHHIFIEVDRGHPNGVDIYIDGKLSNGTWSGPSKITGSLSNTSDFEIGRSSAGNYFNGLIDFLRVSKGTLKEAGTTLEQLREWQFNGPFLQDFSGIPERHNAGAVELTSR